MLRSQTGQPVNELPPSSLMGTVVAVQANYYQVLIEDFISTSPQQGEETQTVLPRTDECADDSRYLLCTRRARLKKTGQQVLVGDRVQVEEADWQGKRGAIAAILPRNSELTRPPIANIDQILLVFALESPSIDPYQLSRFLVTAEMTGIPLTLCLSKADLVSDDAQILWQTKLNEWGYGSIAVSLETNQGLDKLESTLSQRKTVLTGPSGVGKSSLINRLLPDLNLRVSQVSTKLQRGRHTTRHVELFGLPQGGFLADTPGFNLPELEACSPSELGKYFPEIVKHQGQGQCQFSNCLHRDEPNCAVRGQWERYPYYLEFLNLVEQQPRSSDHTEPKFKQKTKASGQKYYEPRLAQKKYRRTSRKSRNQDLQALYQELQ